MSELDDPDALEQLDRERSAVAKAVSNLRQQVETDPVNSAVGQTFMRNSWQELARIISQAQTELRASGHPPLYGHMLLVLNAEHLAFIVLHCIVQELGRKTKDDSEDDEEGKLTGLARRIGDRCRIQWFLTDGAGKKRALLGIAGPDQTVSAAARSRQRAAKILNGDWGESQRDLHLGAELIALAEKAGLVNISTRIGQTSEPKGPKFVELEEHVRESLQWRGDFAKPFFLPMICTPTPWCGLKNGGYLTNSETELNMHLVKHWDNPKIIEGLSGGTYLITEHAVNALQETPWRVSKGVFELAQKINKLRADKKFPKRVSSNLDRVLSICEELVTRDRFYFPYQLDFRGRAYCLPALLNPQADDIGRSLLEFSNAKELGERGAWWLAVHLANAYRGSKGTLEERRNWVEQNERKILDCSNDPLAKRWWMKAEKPWRFIAACFEWSSYRSVGPTVKTRLPVTVDGTCNGFQHLSALLLNTAVAKATNLTPSEQPQDFYQEVAKLLVQRLKRDSKEGKPEARDWLDNGPAIDRKLVKPAVMTTPYGITQVGISRQLFKDFEKTLQTPKQSCDYLARTIQSCIKKKFPEGHQLTKWLQKLASGLAERSLGVHWTTPGGFRVVHENWEGKQRRIKTSCGTLVIYDQKQPVKLVKKRQILGIVANLIHSLDAAHLMHTVERLHRKKFRDFAVIHDGYAMHASDLDELHRTLREEFIGIYKKPVLREFFSTQWMASWGELPPPPVQGDFDIELVRNSKYFFS